uniref:Transcriptional adapter n=1 Tax=Plectus sambesii TaxID=2011161 RepID=A0A914WI59_9BILA
MASSSGVQEDPKKCTNCAEIVTSAFIECAECKEKPVTLCFLCFSLGAELGDHRRGHDYMVRCPGGLPIFGVGPNDESHGLWTSTEEIALIEAAEKYNLGNWEDVASIVNPKRMVSEVKEHYDRFYLRGRIGQMANRGFVRPMATDHSKEHQEAAAANPLISPPIRNTVHKISYDDLRLLAYMPHRDDFEKDWNNEAEELVSKLLPAPDDDSLDKAVKLAHVDMYVRIVAERRKRKAMARDYDLVPAFFKQEKPGLASKAWQYTPQQYQKIKRENDLREQMKKFAQLMPATEFEEIIDGLAKQDLLKERIEELQKYRKNGVTTLEEGAQFDQIERRMSPAPVQTDRVAASCSADGTVTDDASSTWKRPRIERNDDPRSPSDSIIKIEKQTTDGIDSAAGRKDLPSSPSRTDKRKLLSAAELSHCAAFSIDVNDYMLLKVSVLKEEQQKTQGLPQRTNVRQDAVELKTAVRSALRRAGWLPLLA